jgi:hypothetical protein
VNNAQGQITIAMLIVAAGIIAHHGWVDKIQMWAKAPVAAVIASPVDEAAIAAVA